MALKIWNKISHQVPTLQFTCIIDSFIGYGQGQLSGENSSQGRGRGGGVICPISVGKVCLSVDVYILVTIFRHGNTPFESRCALHHEDNESWDCFRNFLANPTITGFLF